MNSQLPIAPAASSHVPAPSDAAAAPLAPLDAELTSRVEAQVEAFMQGLLTADVMGEDFKRRLDAAFRLGRKEVAEATRLNTAFTERNLRGLEASPAYAAMTELRHLMDELNPGRQGDLAAPVKWFGLIPGGTKLKAYLRRFQSAGAQIDALLAQLDAAQDDLDRDVMALEDSKQQMWAALTQLRAAAHFAETLRARIAAHVGTLKLADPPRACALEQEALFYATQNLDGILAQQAVTINGFLALEPLKKCAREMSIGLDRLKTTGMAALAVAQTVAVATQQQIKTQQAMARTKEVVSDLVAQTSQQLGQHVQTVGKFAADPILDVAKLQQAFDSTFKALDALDAIRVAAIETMNKNNEALQKLIDQARPQLERAAGGAAAAKLDPALAGPVALG
jgi:uncharacterized protein YaaN involved in tellurite resistance